MKALSILTFAGILAIAGCTTQRPETTAERRFTNADLEQAVKAKLSSDPTLANAGIGVSADADRNQVTLTGTVATEQMRTQAVALAKAAHPGVVVVDKIEVKPREMSRADYTEDMARETREKAKSAGEKVGDSVDDAWIHTKLAAKLAANETTPATKIDVDVVNNTVTLRGNVDSAAAKAEAERIARETEGVKSVRNQLKVTPASR